MTASILKKIQNTQEVKENASAVTETASGIVGKHRQKKKPWITAEILDLCDKRRELRKNRFEPEGSEKYKELQHQEVHEKG